MEPLGAPASPVPQDAAWLLDLIAGERLVTFQTFGDTKDGRKGLTRVLHGDLKKHAETLADLNARGAGIYFMVNGGDGKGRRANNVREVRAVFADLDGAPLDPVRDFELKPHAIVESSPGRFHAYWLTTGLPVEEFKPTQRAIAALFNGDPSICDPSRVLRLPGFLHMKGEPYLSHLVSLERRGRYSAQTIRKAFAPAPVSEPPKREPRQKLPETIPEGERNPTLFALARGFVNKGFAAPGINQRLQKINAERCKPPLCATEVDQIVSNACSRPATGWVALPHSLLDCEKWRKLPHAARSIVLAAYRRFNGANDGEISLPFEDFADEFGNKSFYRMRDRAIAAGFLKKTRKARYSSQGGKLPDLFGLGVVLTLNGQSK